MRGEHACLVWKQGVHQLGQTLPLACARMNPCHSRQTTQEVPPIATHITGFLEH